MKKSELKEIIREAVFNAMTEELCPRGKAYIAARKRAGEKSSAYLSGRAVKVCKGQIKGAGGKRRKSYKNEGDDAAMKKSALGMAMYGKKAKMNEQDSLEVDVYGYQTKHFDVCPGAQSLYKRIVDEDLVKDKDLVIRTAKLHDALFALEKTALEDGATNLDVESAQLMADQIMEMAKMMNLESEHQYVQGHVEKIKGAVKGETNESIKLKGLVSEIEVADNTEFKVALKHLLQKHATNLKRGDDDTEFKLTLKHLLDKHVVKGGEKKEKAK